MKIYKMLISTLFGVILATLGLTVFSAYADDTTPSILSELEYDMNTEEIMAKIYINNFQPVANCQFFVEIGDGFDFVMDGEYVKYDCQPFTHNTYGPVFVHKSNSGKELSVFNGRADNRNPNGLFLTIYLTETSIATPQNSTFNIILDYFCDQGVNYSYTTANTFVPTMQSLGNMYMLGDTDGDYDVDSTDSYNINYALAYCPYPYYFTVSEIENTFTLYFTDALDAYALDPNCNGTVSYSDAVAINQFIAAGNNYNGKIGKVFYHCYYL